MELISRGEVIKLLSKVFAQEIYSTASTMKEILELPIIESRPKGKWIQTDLDCGKRHIRCNQCWYADCEIPKEKIKDMDYCPQCGAEMER